MIAITLKSNDTFGNLIQKSIAVTVYPAGTTPPAGPRIRSVSGTINDIVREIPEAVLNVMNTVGLFLLKTTIGR